MPARGLPGADRPLPGPPRRRRGWRYGFLAEQRHLNIGGVVHGGMLMSFADDVLGMTVWEAAGRKPCTTVQLNTQFIAPVQAGRAGRSAAAEVLRATRTRGLRPRHAESQGDTVLIACRRGVEDPRQH